VRHHVLALCELFATHEAHERLEAGMHTQMALNTALVGEGLATLIALVVSGRPSSLSHCVVSDSTVAVDFNTVVTDDSIGYFFTGVTTHFNVR
jgi:hypothetical protein